VDVRKKPHSSIRILGTLGITSILQSIVELKRGR
jgi:hypothetical protein